MRQDNNVTQIYVTYKKGANIKIKELRQCRELKAKVDKIFILILCRG